MPPPPHRSASDTRPEGSDGAPAFLAGGGELARLIAAFDWSRTALGPIEGWPLALRTVVALILRSPQAIVTLWGEPGVMIYNDAYAVFGGARHPDLLGRNVLDAWPEAATLNRHVMKTVFDGGGTLEYRDQPLVLHRAGRADEAWLDLTYSPVPGDDGTPIGVIAIVVETTDRVLAGRLLADEQRRLTQMYEQSPSFMALLEGPEHRFVVANAAYQRLVGHRDLLGRSVAEILPDAVEQGYLDLLDGVYRSGESLVANGARYAVQAVPGGASNERYVDFVFQPIRGADGEVRGIFVDGVDVTDRVAAQETIRASEAQFRTFAQAAPNHVWTAPPDGTIDWFNDRILEYAGVAADALLGTGWTSIVHPDDVAATTARWAASLADGSAYEAEFRVRAADGSYRWHLSRAVPLTGDDGRIVRWIGNNTDIHDKKIAGDETMRDRDRLWTLAHNLMLTCDFTGLITAINPAATTMLGWAPEDMIGRNLSDFLHPDDRATTAAEVERLEGGATTIAFENRYRCRDGSYRLLQWNAVPDERRIHAVARDITEERALTRDRERIWNLSPVVKLVITLDGRVVAVNPSWTKVLGWDAAETIGRSVFDFIDPDYRDRASANLSLIGAGERIEETESLFRSRDGERHRIAFTTLREGDTLYAFGRDITQQAAAADALARTEEALRQSQKMEAVGQLTGGIAHDFNNLLQGITGSLEVVQRRIAQGRLGELDRFITGATTAAGRAAALTHRLLAFSRRQPLDPRPVRANPLVASMEDLLRRTLGERVSLELVLAAGLWPTLCDPNQLENAVLNLAINARDAMPDGGQLTIETCNAHLDDAYAAQVRDVRPGQYVCICVSDTGTGMSADTIARAFEPFFTTKPIGQGTGLGLSMIYGFARQSEGYAKIYSEEGKGTTFKLYLPRHRGEVTGDENPAGLGEARATEQGEVVLVVEDEPVVRSLIVETLSELGYNALEAADGPAGVEILRSKQRIDLLVTDIGLPGLNGRQVADAGRALRPGLKVLFMTGYAENAALASGFLEPGMSMITKPFAMEALANRIRTIVEGTGDDLPRSHRFRARASSPRPVQEGPSVKYLHTMIRVADPDATIRFFALLGLKEVRRLENQQGRFTLIFLATPEEMKGPGERADAEVELTYNWPAEDGSAPEVYTGGRNFGHLAYRVDNIYDTCQRLMDAGVTINRPPRDGHMAFVKSPDGISIELLQDGVLEPAGALGVDAEHRQVVMLEVVRVPVLSDNYAWLVHDPDSGATIVVDPGEAEPVQEAAVARGWLIDAVWTTHWHPDHTGGNEMLKAAGAEIVGPTAEAARIPTLDRGIGEGDVLTLGAHRADVMTVPGHTQGHVAFHFADAAMLFTGDTLFAMGCGRLFEGTPADMFANMQRYAALPDETQVFCGHEYTLSNARYVTVAEPGNAAIAARMAEVEAARDRGEATVPTTIGAERATNPFLRAATVERFAELRSGKDAFKG